MVQDPHYSPPFPCPTPAHYKCTNCGHIIPKEDALPQACPSCGAPKEAFFLVEED